MTVLVIAPSVWHVSSLAGGSILKWIASNRPVEIAVPGAGDEVFEMAGFLGGKAVRIDWDEDFWMEAAEGRDSLTDVFRRVEPGLTISTAPTARGPKAAALGRLTFDAAFAATVPHYGIASGAPAAGSRTPLILLDDPFASPRPPLEYVDTHSTWAAKWSAVKMSAEFVEEGEIPASVGTPLDIAEIISRTRGLQVQSAHGEAFAQVRVYGRMRSQRLMP